MQKLSAYLSTSGAYPSAIPGIQTSIRHRKKENHKVDSWSIAVPAARLIHVTVMVETPIQGTSLLILLIHVSCICSTVGHWKPANTSFAVHISCKNAELPDFCNRHRRYLRWPLMLYCHAAQASAAVVRLREPRPQTSLILARMLKHEIWLLV